VEYLLQVEEKKERQSHRVDFEMVKFTLFHQFLLLGGHCF